MTRTTAPEIIINGHKLTSAEAMTLFGHDHGRTMTKLYRHSLENIQRIMLDD